MPRQPQSPHLGATCSALDASNPDGAADAQRADGRPVGEDDARPVAVQQESEDDVRPADVRPADVKGDWHLAANRVDPAR